MSEIIGNGVFVGSAITSMDEGKVVSNGALVAQTAHAEVTQNGTYDTTENNEVVVNVSGAQSDKIWLLNPDEMDVMAAACPTALVSYLYQAANLAYAPIVVKTNNTENRIETYWCSQKGTYGGSSNIAFLGRRGYDRAGLIFAKKIPGGIYSKLKIRYEITTGAFSGAYFRLYLISNIRFGSDVYPVNADLLYNTILNNNTVADNTREIDISNISSDFYVCFVDWNGFVKLRAIWVEI